jgi:molybdopterin synthase sulfur carrier subunit
MARVLLFGPLRDLAGWRERDVQAQTLNALKTALSREDPALGAALDGKGVQVAVDQRIYRGDTELRANAEVAFLPPMSGG